MWSQAVDLYQIGTGIRSVVMFINDNTLLMDCKSLFRNWFILKHPSDCDSQNLSYNGTYDMKMKLYR